MLISGRTKVRPYKPPYDFLVAVNPVGDEIFIVLPSTVPVYLVLPAVNVISLPFIRPWIAWLPSVPEIIWKVWVIVSAPFGVFQVPPTLAGTIHSSAVHQLLEQPSVTVSV